MEKDRYRQIGTRPLPFPLWCCECGVMVADATAHDRFHQQLGATARSAESARMMTDRIG